MVRVFIFAFAYPIFPFLLTQRRLALLPRAELDGWNGTDRNHIDVFVPQQDLVDSYLPSFQTCVEEGKASGVMVRSRPPPRRRAPPAPPHPSPLSPAAVLV